MEANAHFADSCKSILCLLSQGKQHKCSSSASRLLWQSSSGSRQGTRFSTATSEAENTYKRLPLGDSSQEPTCKQSPPAPCVLRLYLFFWLMQECSQFWCSQQGSLHRKAGWSYLAQSWLYVLLEPYSRLYCTWWIHRRRESINVCDRFWNILITKVCFQHLFLIRSETSLP